jgi:endonuclease/exonuclease/phosphatase (EEP) superfamily protein YafD
MRFLHYTLHCDSPVVKIYAAFQHADLITISSATYTQLTQCDPLHDFRILSAQDITQPFGSAVLYRPTRYTLIDFIPSRCSVTLVLLLKPNHIPVAVTAFTLPADQRINLALMTKALLHMEPYISDMPHIIAGDFQLSPSLNFSRMALLNRGYHDLLGQIAPGPTRFRRGYAPDIADYVFYKGSIAAMECLLRPLRRPDVNHEGSDHSPIYVYFFVCRLTTSNV